MGVLAFHAFPRTTPGGFVGVDVFFVISGYVVSLSLLARSSSTLGINITAFYARRIRRLFPALLCLFPAVAIAAFWLLPSQQLALLGKHILSSAGFLQNLTLWQEAGYFDAASHEKWLLHLWSLGIEEQFYLLLPLLFLVLQRPGRPSGRVLATGLTLLAGASFALSLWQSRHAPSAGFYLPLGRFWEFLLGAVLAIWHMRASTLNRDRQSPPSHVTHASGAIAFILLCLVFFLLNERSWQGWSFPGPQAALPAFATFILLSTPRSTTNRLLLSHPAMRYLGLISYPLYLWHWPIMAYLNALDPHHQLPWTRVPGVVLALALAALTYRFVEQPMRRLAAHRPKLATSSLAAGMIAMAVMGWGLWKKAPTSWPDHRAAALAQIPLWDEARLYRDDTCLAHPGVNPWRRDDFFCRGDPDTARWALLGDSHGNAVAAGLMKSMPGQWVNLGGGGCMPFGGVDSGSDDMGLQCPAEIPEAFMRHVITSPNIQGVLINVRGAFYVNGTDVGSAAEGRQRWLRETPEVSSSTPKRAADNAAIFRAGVRRTLHALGPTGKQVIWLLNTPELGADVSTCLNPLAGQAWLGSASACAITASSHMARNTVYRDIVLSEIRRWNAERPPGTSEVKTLNPAEALCKAGQCALVMDGVPLYRDGDHLSMQGSDLLARWLLPRLSAQKTGR